MKSTEIKGVWSHTLKNNAIMLVDLNHNQIRVKPENGNTIKYDFDGDITVREFAQIIESHEK